MCWKLTISPNLVAMLYNDKKFLDLILKNWYWSIMKFFIYSFYNTLSSITRQKYLSNQIFVLMGSEWHEKWKVHGNINRMNNQKSLVLWRMIVSRWLVKTDLFFWLFDKLLCNANVENKVRGFNLSNTL